MSFAEELAKLANLGILDHDGSLLGLRGNHIVNRQARGGGNSNCRWAGILIVADHTQNDLLFGMIAFRTGAVEADQLAETCALGSADGSVSLADRLVDRGCLTIEQKTRVESLGAEKCQERFLDKERVTR
jgi:hypothetical protein